MSNTSPNIQTEGPGYLWEIENHTGRVEVFADERRTPEVIWDGDPPEDYESIEEEVLTAVASFECSRRAPVTMKGRPFCDWWNPIKAYLEERAPVFDQWLLASPFDLVSDELFVRSDSTFMFAVRTVDGELRLSGFLAEMDDRNKIQSNHIFEGFFPQGFDEKTAWRIGTLLQSIFDGQMLDAEHREELESLLFSL